MKSKILLIFCFAAFVFNLNAQTAITAVASTNSSAATSFNYVNGTNTYNWGVSPNNTRVALDGFTAGGQNFSYASFINGTVKLRRVNNANVTGNFTLVWSEAVTSGTTFNMFAEYQNNMESFFDDRVYNKGTDNLFDNSSFNSNNIERLDWILSSAYSTTSVAGVGFAIFERGATAAHDPFCIAAITAVDAMGNPTAYGNIVRVAATNYGDPGPNVTYRVLKALNPSNLIDAANGTQNRGGVIISLQSLGITAGQEIFGYSLFSNDLPMSATPANLVDFTNTTFFPTNTGGAGGIDLIAITGIYIENSLLSLNFKEFTANNTNNNTYLNWSINNEIANNSYEVQRSINGNNFTTIQTIVPQNIANNNASYSTVDFNTNLINAAKVYYRIKQIDDQGKINYSKIIAIKVNVDNSNQLSVYNIQKESMQVNYTSATSEPLQISLMATNGAIVNTQKEVAIKGNNNFNLIALQKLPTGIYLLTIKTESGINITKQLVKP
jgi:hypothetical protein